MKFCSECLQYSEIQNIIKSNDKKGDCDIQESHLNVNICDTESDLEILNSVKNTLLEIIDLYTVNSSLPDRFPEELKSSLSDALAYKWSIFSLNSVNIQNMLRILFENDEYFDHKMFDEKVAIIEEDDHQEEYLIVQDNNWEAFTKSLKYKNRFHTHHLHLDRLAIFIENSKKTINSTDSIYYRTRINNDKNKFLKKTEMSAPPADKSAPGRLNAEGISTLYMCTNFKTSIKEVRASFEDTIFIGEFKLKRSISVIDLTKFEDSSLFSDNDSENLLSYYFNRDTLKKIAEELSRPTNTHDSAINYIPTQYISDYIKSLASKNNADDRPLFDGILFESTMDTAGLNLALFDPDIARCIKVHKQKVNGIEYDLEELN